MQYNGLVVGHIVPRPVPPVPDARSLVTFHRGEIVMGEDAKPPGWKSERAEERLVRRGFDDEILLVRSARDELDVKAAGHLRGCQFLVRERPKPWPIWREFEFFIPKILDDARKTVAKSKPLPIFPNVEIVDGAVIVEFTVSVGKRIGKAGHSDPRRGLTANELNPIAQCEIQVLLIHAIQHRVAINAGVDHSELHHTLRQRLRRAHYALRRS